MRASRFYSKLLALVLTLSFSFFSFASPALAAWDDNCTGTGIADDVATISGLECVFENVLSLILTLLGLAVFVMIIAAAISWLVSGGDPQKVEKAKSTLGMAISGLALVFVVWFVLLFISKVTGIDSLLFFSITTGN